MRGGCRYREQKDKHDLALSSPRLILDLGKTSFAKYLKTSLLEPGTVLRSAAWEASYCMSHPESGTETLGVRLCNNRMRCHFVNVPGKSYEVALSLVGRWNHW